MTDCKWVTDDDWEMKRQAMEFMADTKNAITRLEASGIYPSIVEAVKVLCACERKIITSGMGKGGHAAAKVASTLSSLGLSACYLHPADASHGDAGIIQAGDVLLVFSTSGKTREVIETIDLARKLGVSKVVAITSHSDSPIRVLADVVVDMGVVKEAGHLSMAPTTSIVIMLIVADMIATIAAWKKGLTIGEFGIRHHSGYLGAVARGDGVVR